jgi:hypothetical protein
MLHSLTELRSFGAGVQSGQATLDALRAALQFKELALEENARIVGCVTSACTPSCCC